MTDKTRYRIIPDWSIPEGRKRTDGDKVRVHPYRYISYVQKRLGLEKAMEVAYKLVKKKYDQKFDRLKFEIPEKK